MIMQRVCQNTSSPWLSRDLQPQINVTSDSLLNSSAHRSTNQPRVRETLLDLLTSQDLSQVIYLCNSGPYSTNSILASLPFSVTKSSILVNLWITSKSLISETEKVCEWLLGLVAWARCTMCSGANMLHPITEHKGLLLTSAFKMNSFLSSSSIISSITISLVKSLICVSVTQLKALK